MAGRRHGLLTHRAGGWCGGPPPAPGAPWFKVEPALPVPSPACLCLGEGCRGVRGCVRCCPCCSGSPGWRSGSCSAPGTSGSMKYLRLQGCDLVTQSLSLSSPPPPLRAGLWVNGAALFVLSTSCSPLSVLLSPLTLSRIDSLTLTTRRDAPIRSSISLLRVGSRSGLTLGWAAWAGSCEVRGQFFPPRPPLWATVEGQSLPPYPRRPTGLCFPICKMRGSRRRPGFLLILKHCHPELGVLPGLEAEAGAAPLSLHVSPPGPCGRVNSCLSDTRRMHTFAHTYSDEVRLETDLHTQRSNDPIQVVPLGSHMFTPICCSFSSISGNPFGIISELVAYALTVLSVEWSFVLWRGSALLETTGGL